MGEDQNERAQIEAYVQSFALEECLDEAINAVVEARPANPYMAIANFMEKKTLPATEKKLAEYQNFNIDRMIGSKVKKKKLINKQKDFQHKSSRSIVNYCVENNIGKLIVGDINVKSVINKDNYRINGLSKSTTSLGRFKTFLDYKSRNEGIEFILVNEAYTSKINCLTGRIEFDSSLDNREFIYEGIIIDRDVNSCINIVKKSGLWLSQDSVKDLLLNKISELKV
jgi:putative transposase